MVNLVFIIVNIKVDVLTLNSTVLSLLALSSALAKLGRRIHFSVINLFLPIMRILLTFYIHVRPSDVFFSNTPFYTVGPYLLQVDTIMNIKTEGSASDDVPRGLRNSRVRVVPPDT